MRKISTIFFIMCFYSALFAQYAPLYRKAITITNDSSASFTNYQVYLKINTATLVSSGYLQNDGDDIRFSPDQCSPVIFYDYYIENYMNTDSTVIWVKLPVFNSMTSYTFYMFYGDTSNIIASNFANTFPGAFISSGNFTLTGNNVYDWFQINSGDSLIIPAGDSTLTIESRNIINNGVIYGQGRGFQVTGLFSSAGTGPGGGLIASPMNSGSGGAGYGGAGGVGCSDAGDAPGAGGLLYGTTGGEDIQMGSSGGSSDNTLGGNGGGTITLKSEVIQNNGIINLDGNSGILPGGSRGGGGGAGGGLKIQCNELRNMGTLSSAGGHGSDGTAGANDGGGGGGGGRIKLFYEIYPVSGIKTVSGGTAGINGSVPGAPGDNGTIYEELRSYFGLLSVGTQTTINSYNTINETAFAAYISPSGNYTWTTSGIYTDTVSNAIGCDSILTINLTILGGLTPELIYYKFNESGTTVTNYATTPPSGTATGTIVGAETQGSNGQCGGALIGSGGTSDLDYVNTGWVTDLTNTSWTISFWTSDITPSASLSYIFGDNSAGSLRCFTNGVAGADNWILRGPMADVLITGAAVIAPTLTTIVYDTAAGEIRAYVNAVLNNTVAQTPFSISGTGPFKVGGYGSSNCLLLNGLMDEFRIYNRALNQAEINGLMTLNTTSNIVTDACFSYLSPSGNYTWTSSGIYNDTIPNAEGCDSIITVNLTINNVDTSVIQNTDTLNAVAGGAIYQWLNCDLGLAPISGEINQQFIAAANGNYALEITQNGCVDTSSCFNINSVGVLENLFGSEFILFPNPTSGKVKISLGKTYSDVYVSVKNTLGQIISETVYSSADLMLLEIAGPSGYYLVDIKTGEGDNALIKVMKY